MRAALRLSPLAVGATLRIRDSLQEGTSRFYAEIARLRRPRAHRADGPVPLLFLLDEILHGTNSHDRRLGAEAIVRGLVEPRRHRPGHDARPGPGRDRRRSRGPRAANVHFEDHLENGQMIFDYRMRPGVVPHGNALALMRTLGLWSQT